MRRYTLIYLIIVALFASGCANRHKEKPERTEAEHYAEVQRQIGKKNYLTAIDELQELEARFPYGDYTEQAQLDLIYTQFRALDYPAVVATATRFQRSYPTHEHLHYVLYMKGLANYQMERGMMDGLLGPDKSSRDLSSWKDAFRNFNELITRFPDSEFVPDAKARMVYIRNMLAEQELHAARYYARRGAYIAAVNRAQNVIIHYQRTPAVPEALAIMNKSYLAMGEKELAAKSYRVLVSNWPDSEFIRAKKEEARLAWWPVDKNTWLSWLTFDLL